jgi:hypothetical protein
MKKIIFLSAVLLPAASLLKATLLCAFAQATLPKPNRKINKAAAKKDYEHNLLAAFAARNNSAAVKLR